MSKMGHSDVSYHLQSGSVATSLAVVSLSLDGMHVAVRILTSSNLSEM